MLDHYFDRPQTLDRIRASWFADPIERYVAWAAARGYARATVRTRVAVLVRFGEYAARRGARRWEDLPALVVPFRKAWVRKARPYRRSRRPQRDHFHAREVQRAIEHMIQRVLPDYPGASPPRRLPSNIGTGLQSGVGHCDYLKPFGLPAARKGPFQARVRTRPARRRCLETRRPGRRAAAEGNQASRGRRTPSPAGWESLEELREVVREWLHSYNYERPLQALDWVTPAKEREENLSRARRDAKNRIFRTSTCQPRGGQDREDLHDRHRESDSDQHGRAGRGSRVSAGREATAEGQRVATLGSERLEYRIRGMDCAEEVTALKRELAPLVDGEDCLAFDLINAKLVVAAGGGVLPQQIVAAVERAGLHAEPWQERGGAQEGFWVRHGRVLIAALSGLFFFAGMAAHMTIEGSLAAPFGAEGAEVRHALPLAVRILYGIGILAGFWLVIPRAWSAVRRLRPDMNLLMSVAVLGAIAIDEWFEAGAVAFLFAVSLALEAWSIGRARRAVEALMDLAPPVAHLSGEDGQMLDVDPSSVGVGSRVFVKPGERIPLDGIVLSGESDVNQAPITGESLPVPKVNGLEVFAGTINGDGTLVVETTKDAEHTTLARIIRMVGEAHSRRAPSEQWVDRFARIYTPAVMVLALGLLALPPLVLGAPFADWLYRALVLLVIACPCALVISTPVSIVAALTAAARQGVLVKGGRYLEAPAHLRAIAFDKTGTLTEGRPRVVELVALDRHTEEELLARAAAMEAHSDHPLARAIVEIAGERGIRAPLADQFQILPGRGATARLEGVRYWLGSHRYLEERGQETPELHERLEEMSREGRSVVIVGNERHACGLIGLADGVRTEARATLTRLRSAGIDHLVMLTGDNRATAQAIAGELGLTEVRAELLPEDKVRAVEELVSEHGAVAMVGDGVNDAPAMARASFGIAMAAAGSDAAIETADIALMSDDLSRLPWLVAHSRRTLRTIRQNIAAALLVKGIFVILTFVGTASLWSAIAADMGASLLVIFNSLKLAGGSAAPREI